MKAAIMFSIVILTALVACATGPCFSLPPGYLWNQHIASGDHSPEWMPDSSAIIILADFQLWMVPVDGSRIQRVGSRREEKRKAAISPSGAFAYYTELGMVKMARSVPEVARKNPALQIWSIDDMAWSSDDRLAAVGGGVTTLSAYYGGAYASVRPFFPGGEVPQPRRAAGLMRGPVWSPNGELVASMVYGRITTDTGIASQRWYLFLLGANGAYQQVIPITSEYDEDYDYQMSSPAWSLDGKRIYYVTHGTVTRGTAEGIPEGPPILHALDLETGETQAIATLEHGLYWAVRMSPTGEQILLVSQSVNVRHGDKYELQRPENGALYTIQPDGQNLRRIWDGYAHASWSPDGQAIAVWTPLLPDDTWLWLIDSTGANRTPLMKQDGRGNEVAGSPPR